jgi:hypothetical protein
MKIKSLSDIQQASLQYIYDQVKNHLLKQKKKSMFNEQCDFISPDGCRCSVGCLMSEEEAYTYRGLSLDLINPILELDETKQDLLDLLVDCHDCYEVEDWETKLVQIAEIFDLVQ